ncbi:MAG: family 20 glycosylhydrolase [Pseudomonadota bacterium]
MFESASTASFDPLFPRPKYVSAASGTATVPVAFLRVPAATPWPAAALGRCERALARLNGQLARHPDAQGNGSIEIEIAAPAAPAPALGANEAYELNVAETAVSIRAPELSGVLHALESLAQLCLAGSRLPCGTVRDAPRFVWRGLMLDPARHFLPLPVLRRTLDGMAAAHLNVLHLHLTDDQGFRFASEAYPTLASEQAYGPAELTELVAYAADRGIRIIPELDVPGHVTHMLTAMPQWAPRDGSGQSLALGLAPTVRFGVHEATLDPLRDDVRGAMRTLLDELCACFPDEYLHLGGDEVHADWWQRSPALAEPGNAVDCAALQADFNAFLHAELTARGRRLLVWDEALHPALATLKPPVTIQNWRGATTRDQALAAGHPCVVSSGYYLDLHYPAHWHYGFDPAAPQPELLALEDELLEAPGYESVADGMRWTHQWRRGAVDPAAPVPGHPEDAPGLLGGEACLWGELVDSATLDLRLWTRLPAIAERFWSQPERCDPSTIDARAEAFLDYLRRAGRNDIRERQREALLQAGVPEAWHALLTWFEPIKWYGRLLGMTALRARLAGAEMPQARPYDTTVPLTGVIDHLPVESPAGARLRRALQRGDAAEMQAGACREQWAPLLQGAFEIQQQGPPEAPPALAIVRDCRVRLAALDALCAARLAGSAVDPDAVSALLEPQADLLLAPALWLAPWLGGERE